jgi:hypothetical protein
MVHLILEDKSTVLYVMSWDLICPTLILTLKILWHLCVGCGTILKQYSRFENALLGQELVIQI